MALEARADERESLGFTWQGCESVGVVHSFCDVMLCRLNLDCIGVVLYVAPGYQQEPTLNWHCILKNDASL